MRAVAGAALGLVLLGVRLGAQVPSPSAAVPSRRLPRTCEIGAAGPPGTHRAWITSATPVRVELELVSQGVRLSADIVDYYVDRHHLTAVGHVVFVTPTAASRPSGGVQHHAGPGPSSPPPASASWRRVDRSLFGAQEPDVYFYGETIEKLGPRTYKITKGGFTTCVQPTPRWEMVSTR